MSCTSILETLKQRLDAIQPIARGSRACLPWDPLSSGFTVYCQALLHYHHPLMPGYLDSNVPVAFASTRLMKPNATILKNWNCIAVVRAQEPPKRRAADHRRLLDGRVLPPVGQSCSSDLDIWVCHQAWLDSEERQLLQRKCSLLGRAGLPRSAWKSASS
ncbi:hypothetical protein LN650_00435 [Klebsiella pneumoniae subsp. pneumoniae]|nr:hypothetical protein [Klebsiella pneumoniae subsp. pneumoniae]